MEWIKRNLHISDDDYDKLKEKRANLRFLKCANVAKLDIYSTETLQNQKRGIEKLIENFSNTDFKKSHKHSDNFLDDLNNLDESNPFQQKNQT